MRGRDLPHNFVKGDEWWYCKFCGASFDAHCITGEHAPSKCPGDHGK